MIEAIFRSGSQMIDQYALPNPTWAVLSREMPERTDKPIAFDLSNIIWAQIDKEALEIITKVKKP